MALSNTNTLRMCAILNDNFITNLLLNERWKSVDIWRSTFEASCWYTGGQWFCASVYIGKATWRKHENALSTQHTCTPAQVHCLQSTGITNKSPDTARCISFLITIKDHVRTLVFLRIFGLMDCANQTIRNYRLETILSVFTQIVEFMVNMLAVSKFGH